MRILKPFVLASKGAGTVAEKAEQAKAALAAGGFTVVGDYSPYPDAEILIVTNDELKKNAADSEHGGFGAIQRVAITKVKDEVQVSYTNPVYMANVYRMKGDLSNVAAQLGKRAGQGGRVRLKGGDDRRTGAQIPLHDRHGIFRRTQMCWPNIPAMRKRCSQWMRNWPPTRMASPKSIAWTFPASRKAFSVSR